MSGRPSRQRNEDLCDRLQSARLQAGLSVAQLAAQLSVSPSTLTRSFNKSAFSRDLALAAEGLLQNWLTLNHAGRQFNQAKVALQLLHKLTLLAPDLELALNSLVDRHAETSSRARRAP